MHNEGDIGDVQLRGQEQGRQAELQRVRGDGEAPGPARGLQAAHLRHRTQEPEQNIKHCIFSTAEQQC